MESYHEGSGQGITTGLSCRYGVRVGSNPTYSLGGRTSASAEFNIGPGGAVHWPSCTILLSMVVVGVNGRRAPGPPVHPRSDPGAMPPWRSGTNSGQASVALFGATKGSAEPGTLPPLAKVKATPQRALRLPSRTEGADRPADQSSMGVRPDTPPATACRR
jgi:hypothetical protein